MLLYYITLLWNNQGEVLYIIKPQSRYTLARDVIQGRRAALDDIPSLREPLKLGKLASGNPDYGLDKQKENICG